MSALDCLEECEQYFDFKIVLIIYLTITQPRQNPDIVILVIFNVDLIITQHCWILHSTSIEWLISYPQVSLPFVWSVNIQ